MVKTISETLDASKRVTNYIQSKGSTPKTVNVGGETVSRPSFNRMMAAAIIEINNNTNQNIRTDSIDDPSNPMGGLPENKLLKADYIDAAQRTKDFIEANKQMPNYINTPLGQMSPYNFMDMYSRALNFYADEKYLPAFIYTNSLGGGTSPSQPTQPSVPDDLKPFLDKTANCQVNDPVIQNLAKQFTTAEQAFNYVRDAYGYDYYYNTRRGALGTYRDKKGNCVDLSHLLIAILRAMGIPAMYRHVLAQFKSGQIGHVYVRAYVNGEYVALDASNNNNGYNNIVSWKLVQVYNNYRELPF
ncbi:MAG: transglutaminase family protein [Methanobacterium formicicum]|uniref:transglutaminase-like domain-containing protein n=1 Tax=Methanobacterium formicicum TaxID=2162 RepID=UPI003531390D